jgi:hypothetical protein
MKFKARFAERYLAAYPYISNSSVPRHNLGRDYSARLFYRQGCGGVCFYKTAAGKGGGTGTAA